VIVLARTSKAASRLSAQLRDRKFKKEYLAVIRGALEPPIGRLRHFLAKDSATNLVHQTESGLEAVLDYRLLESVDGLSLVSIQLHTGRPHQIRAQMSLVGYPLYGDQKYGREVNKPGEQLALWSSEVAFTHPVRDEWLSVQSMPPACYPWSLFSCIQGGKK